MRYDKTECVSEGIDTIHIDGNRTSIFLHKENDFIPFHAGRMNTYYIVYKISDTVSVFVPF